MSKSDERAIERANKILDSITTKDGLIQLPSMKKSKFIKGITKQQLEIMTYRLIDESNQVLAKNGYGILEKDFEKLNMMDISSTFSEFEHDETVGKGEQLPHLTSKESEDFKNVVEELINGNIFNAIPCFEEGVLRVNKRRYFYWKIKEITISEENTFISIRLQGYVKSNGVWAIYPFEEFEMKKIGNKIETYVTTYLSQSQFYELVDFKESKWNEDEIFVWKNFVAKSYDEQINLKNKKEINKTVQGWVQKEVEFFLLSMYRINKSLEKQKLSRAKSIKKASKPHNISTIAVPTNSEKETRKIRKVAYGNGEISIISEKAPKNPNEEYVRHYSVSSWTVRATVRHYKSGKVVRVKEHTNTRHALKDTKGLEITSVTIKIE